MGLPEVISRSILWGWKRFFHERSGMVVEWRRVVLMGETRHPSVSETASMAISL